MDLKSLLQLAHSILTEAQIDHALIGGIALGALGVQRFTNDIDFLVAGEDRSALKLAFLKRGFSIFFESPEVIQLEGPGYIDVLFANRPLSKTMLRHAKSIPGFEVKCASAEAIIGLKIQAYVNDPKREFQDKADIQGLIANNPDIDWQVVKEYADVFSEWQTIEHICSKLTKNK